MKKVILFAGSISQNSINVKFINNIAKKLTQNDVPNQVIDLAQYDIPFFDENTPNPSDDLIKLKDILSDAAAWVIASPEYNGFFTPRLKNLIDWLSVVDISIFYNRYVATISASPGKLGGVRGLPHLRTLLGNLGSICTPTQFALGEAYKCFDESDSLINQPCLDACDKIVSEIKTLIA